jgi:hypothetical protein
MSEGMEPANCGNATRTKWITRRLPNQLIMTLVQHRSSQTTHRVLLQRTRKELSAKMTSEARRRLYPQTRKSRPPATVHCRRASCAKRWLRPEDEAFVVYKRPDSSSPFDPSRFVLKVWREREKERERHCGDATSSCILRPA